MATTSFDYSKRQEEIIESIITFIYDHICKWRDDPNKVIDERERILNSDLPKFLTVCAHKDERGFNFYPEEPQEGQRTIDFSVCYDDVNCYNEKITVFECKRLSSEITRTRKDEYVTGHEEITGGIQRFKLEVHGKDHDIVGMIGYIQTENYQEWFNKINNIVDVLGGKSDENGLTWNKNEFLNIVLNDSKKRKYYSKSIHHRKTKANIKIHHLWIDLQKCESKA